MPVGKTYKQTITIVSMKQEINTKEVHAKIKEEMGQNMMKSRKLFFQFSKFVKINCRENVLEDKNAKINIRVCSQFLQSMQLNTHETYRNMEHS